MDLSSFSQKLDQTYSELKKNISPRTQGYTWRTEQLRALKRLLTENDGAFNAAMWADLRKSPFECSTTEQGLVIGEIDFTLHRLADWMEPQKVSTPLFNQPGICETHPDPLGLVLIIGAWNYPLQLLLAPLVGAIAGGNGAILKPSELAVQTAQLIARLIPLYLDPRFFAVIEGGPDETGLLLDKAFDLIFFTGSGPVGKIVMGKAAKNLTPVVLELGGKSPALVLNDADLEVTARRIAWGKFMNAGQTCVAPDYVLVQPQAKERFIEEMKKAILHFYGLRAEDSPDYCRIINAKNFDRLHGLLNGTHIICGGRSRAEERFIEPTLLSSAVDAPVMQKEIFGPLLPILEMATLEEMIAFVNSRAKPLSLYLFTRNENLKEKVLLETSAGGVCINDVIMHMPVHSLPFGGVGASGMGHYHGKFSFTTFTHAKAVLRKSTWFDLPIRYAPYTLRKLRWLRWLF